MKKILVIDESELVRETIALILGQEYAVVRRPLGDEGFSFLSSDEDVRLLILGVTPAMGAEAGYLLRFASQIPCAVLFLVDSEAATGAIEEAGRIACLAKPFSPRALKTKVANLFSPRARPPDPAARLLSREDSDLSRYLRVPFLSRAVSELARRFAAARLPLLIHGEVGCGQERVVRAIQAIDDPAGPVLFLNATEVNERSLGEKEMQISKALNDKRPGPTLIIEEVEKLDRPAQAPLLKFLRDQEERRSPLRLLATAGADMLESVYQGRFLDELYYKVAMLTLRLPPLRERREEMPMIASWFAQVYGARLGLGDVVLSPDAIERLRNYLWFSNMHELEAVIARTLALHRKTRIEAADLYWDFSAAERIDIASEPSVVKVQGSPDGVRKISDESPTPEQQAPGSTNGRLPDLKVLIHELAHELKNPMVTIKTFAQLLGERYQDEAFRARFQDIVDGDIERIDELLEVMIEFANFSQPTPGKIPLQSRLRSVLEEISADCAKRQAQVRWKGEGIPRQILADEDQLKYALKNAMLAVLSQSRRGSEIVIDMESPGALNIGYVREGGRINAITHYFDLSSARSGEGILPLRILLAKQLVERNGGQMIIQRMDEERDLLKMEFPVADGE